MSCCDARNTLWPPDRPRLVDGDVGRARAHVDACESCQDYFAQDRRLLAAYQRLQEERAPGSVRERVFAAMADERKAVSAEPLPAPARRARRGRRAWTRPAAGVAVAALALSLGVSVRSAGVGATNDPYIEDYLRRAVAQERITTSDPALVARFLTRELGLSLRPLEIRGYRLAGAEICLLAGKRGAMIVYERDGESLSHYLLPVEGRTRQPALTADAERRVISDEPALVTWADGDIEQALVAALEPQTLLAIARGAASGGT